MLMYICVDCIFVLQQVIKSFKGTSCSASFQITTFHNDFKNYTVIILLPAPALRSRFHETLGLILYRV